MGPRPDIERLFELCDGLDDNIPDQRDIKKYLMESLLIKACVEYENEIGRIVAERAAGQDDEDLQSFLARTVLAYKHLSLDSLQGNIAGKFSGAHKREFIKRVDDDAARAYRGIVSSRNAAAHGGRVDITYEEFKTYYGMAGRVLDELVAVLKLRSSDL